MPSAISTMMETTLLDMKVGFPPPPELIQGIPRLQSLIKLLFHLCRCAQTHQSPASTTMNLLICAAPCDVYTFLTTNAYPNAFAPFPPEVPNVPNYTACIDDNDRAMVRVTHARDKKMQADIITMNTALVNIFLGAMSSQVRASFQQRCLCKPNIIFVNFFLWFVNQNGMTMAKDCEANRQHMAANWHPANRFDALILRLFTGAAYASSAGFRMNDVNIVNIDLRIIKQCGMYGKEYKAWIACKAVRPCIIKMVDMFKTFWAAKITLVNQTAIPASMHGYGMAAMNNNDSVTSYGELIANFGFAYAATQESVKSQGATIASMQGQMQAMHQYCMALGQQPPPGIYTLQQQQCGRLSALHQEEIPARRISWRLMPAAATHPLQDV
jgi:hypothetical protein